MEKTTTTSKKKTKITKKKPLLTKRERVEKIKIIRQEVGGHCTPIGSHNLCFIGNILEYMTFEQGLRRKTSSIVDLRDQYHTEIDEQSDECIKGVHKILTVRENDRE